ncbi:hypothetical protein I314_05466 [Cryptococcus bacillisporus CA1873]|uniref:Uncharacterized protein n=2 Tax=Cryptococcus gattii TaxID=552467 RepID=A0A0D0TVI5_CRYGA|nr:hypothetical protein I312_00518 [Cryptococcus bacillisporus CA1280]KIR58627.1 hypothetical protein I314_05466 [Cryptococcus bacillisporus CA1873]|eukprot:KIR58627.1 hypothetical protein I314_05466 [Cryptococcus gattii CA1873]
MLCAGSQLVYALARRMASWDWPFWLGPLDYDTALMQTISVRLITQQDSLLARVSCLSPAVCSFRLVTPLLLLW